MNLSTPVRSTGRSRTGPPRAELRSTPPRRGMHPASPSSGSRALAPVAPVVFLEPSPEETEPAPSQRRTDHGDETLRRLRTPFIPDEAGDR